tara:strand:+ start:2223 stop:2696 length:474 start_codon:yes stop_codon:yes gene_type:complete
MPNHTANKLTVNGPSDAVTRFKLENAGDEEFLSFENVSPTPSEMLGDNAIKDGLMPDWYTWRVDNWGTKWDAYDTGEWEGDTITFFSAWSPPIEWLREVAKKYPDLAFTLDYADEGGHFVGTMEASGHYGEGISEPDWDSPRGIKLRKSLGYYYDEE